MKTRIKKFRIEEELGGAACDVCNRGKVHTIIIRDGEELAACKKCASSKIEKTAIELGSSEDTSEAYVDIIKSQAELTIQDIAAMTKNLKIANKSKKRKVIRKKTTKKKKR